MKQTNETFWVINIIKNYIFKLYIKRYLWLKNYNKGILQGIISKLYNIHGTSIMNAITIGNKTVQQ